MVLAAVPLIVVATTDGVDAGQDRLGGDYPAFYGAGRIAATGDWAELYLSSRQLEAQSDLFTEPGNFLYFAYPPQVAALYRPLAALSYEWSYVLHALLMGAAVALAVRLAKPWISAISWSAPAAIAATLLMYPILIGVYGGQNTALTLLLIVAAARLEHDKRPFGAGLAIAALLFKPQFGLAMVALAVVGRRWRMAEGWAVGAAGFYALGLVTVGWTWPADWASQAWQFNEMNLVANGSNFVSALSFTEGLLGRTGLVLLGLPIAVGVGLWAARIWARAGGDAVANRYGAAAVAIVLAAPSALFYDGGLTAITLGVAVSQRGRRVTTIAAAIWVLSWIQVAASSLGASPGFLLLLGTWALHHWGSPRHGPVVT